MILVRKFLRDIWLPLLVVALLLGAFQCLWAHVTQQITTELLPELTDYILEYRKSLPLSFIVPEEQVKQQVDRVGRDLQQLIFKGPGKIVQSLVGGENVSITSPMNLMTVGYVHPLIQAILCIWAIGRAAGAIAGEIDRGTMELLLAQPVARWRLVLAHFLVDVLVFPVLALSLWAGTWLGTWLTGLMNHPDAANRVDPMPFAAALPEVGLLLFAISGMTMLVSSMGRFRGRVLGLAVLITLLQFLVNLIGQVWAPAERLRPFTIFYYYQPQPLILGLPGTAVWWHLAVLGAVGAGGYLLAVWWFERRDLPAPL